MLEKLEDALSCLICKELLEIPEQASCDHTFCALCIRRHLTTDQNCPVCRKEMHGGGLRRIKVLENVVEEYRRISSSLKEALNPVDKEATPSTYPEPDLAQCPVCLKELPVQEIQGTHIVECLRPKQDYKRRAIVNYSILKDKDLRALLQKDGLSADGSRSKLIARHNEYILQWNVNALKSNPSSPMELRIKVEKWESALQHKQKKVEVDGWAAQNSDMFRDLESQAYSKMGRSGPRKRRLSEIVTED